MASIVVWLIEELAYAFSEGITLWGFLEYIKKLLTEAIPNIDTYEACSPTFDVRCSMNTLSIHEYCKHEDAYQIAVSQYPNLFAKWNFNDPNFTALITTLSEYTKARQQVTSLDQIFNYLIDNKKCFIINKKLFENISKTIEEKAYNCALKKTNDEKIANICKIISKYLFVPKLSVNQIDEVNVIYKVSNVYRDVIEKTLIKLGVTKDNNYVMITFIPRVGLYLERIIKLDDLWTLNDYITFLITYGLVESITESEIQELLYYDEFIPICCKSLIECK